MRVSRYVIGMAPNGTGLRLRISSVRSRCRGRLSSSSCPRTRRVRQRQTGQVADERTRAAAKRGRSARDSAATSRIANTASKTGANSIGPGGIRSGHARKRGPIASAHLMSASESAERYQAALGPMFHEYAPTASLRRSSFFCPADWTLANISHCEMGDVGYGLWAESL